MVDWAAKSPIRPGFPRNDIHSHDSAEGINFTDRSSVSLTFH